MNKRNNNKDQQGSDKSTANTSEITLTGVHETTSVMSQLFFCARVMLWNYDFRCLPALRARSNNSHEHAKCGKSFFSPNSAITHNQSTFSPLDSLLSTLSSSTPHACAKNQYQCRFQQQHQIQC